MLLWISHAYISIWFSLVNLPMSFQLHTSQKNQWGRGNFSSPQMCLCDMKKERMSFYLFVTRWHLHCLTISNLRCCALLVVVEMGLVVGKLAHQGSFTFSCAQDWDKCLNQTFFWYYEPFCLWSQCLASDRNWSCRDIAFLCDPSWPPQIAQALLLSEIQHKGLCISQASPEKLEKILLRISSSSFLIWPPY